MADKNVNAFSKIYDVLRFERREISEVYFYAILNGLVNLSLPLGIQSIISFVLGGSISTSLVLLIIFVVAGVFLNGLLQVNQLKIIEKIQQQLFVRYTFMYAYKLPRIDLKATDGYYMPEMVNRVFDTATLQKGLSKLLIDFPSAIIQITFSLALLSFYHPIFIFFSLLLVTVLIVILRLTGLKGLQTSIVESDYKYKVAGYLEDMARSLISFKFSIGNGLHIRKTDEYVSGYIKARTSHFNILQVQYWTFIAFKLLITASMLTVGASLLVDQQLNIGQFIASELIIMTVISYVEKIIVSLDNVYDIITSAEKLNKLPEKTSEQSGEWSPETGRQGFTVSLRDVTFGYKPDHNVVTNVSIEVNAGEKVTITGPQSGGKSTLLKLIAGLYNPGNGVVSISNIPVGQYDKQTLRTHISILLQHIDIFEGTVWDNITMGNQGTRLEDVSPLVDLVGLNNFINSSADGYQRLLPTAGIGLSQKVAKKILLVRALVKKPSLLLLEEPWLGLEEEYARNIQNYLLQQPATTFIINHNDEFAERCDKVITLDKGYVIAQTDNRK